MRKKARVKIEDEGRDQGKVFIVREAPASTAERWATRALLALAHSGVELPENMEGAGWAGIAVMGFQALARLSYEEAQPLLDEMWQCVSICPDQRHPDVTRALMWAGLDGEGADIEELSTMLRLRKEVFELHTGFSIPGASTTSQTSRTPGSEGSQSTTTPLPSTEPRLRRSSPPGKRR